MQMEDSSCFSSVMMRECCLVFYPFSIRINQQGQRTGEKERCLQNVEDGTQTDLIIELAHQERLTPKYRGKSQLEANLNEDGMHQGSEWMKQIAGKGLKI